MTITAEDLKKLPTPTATVEAQSGKDTLLYLEAPGSTTETPKWTLVGGQRDCTLDMSSDSIDASHKTSGGWQTKLQGLKTWSITYTGLQVIFQSTPPCGGDSPTVTIGGQSHISIHAPMRGRPAF